jgi:hypothetical protein
MKKGKVLSYLLLVTILITSLVPLNVFAETDIKYSISGYVSVRENMPVLTDPGIIGIPEQFPKELYDGLKAGVKVEILGTDLYTYTDSNGYFIISQVPANSEGYVLRLSDKCLVSKEITIESFNASLELSLESSPIMMDIDWDVNDDGKVNMIDMLYFASLINKPADSYKISGYIKVDREWTYGDLGSIETVYVPEKFSEGLKIGVQVTVDGTELSAVSDKNGYFEIANVPAKETGYVLKLSKDMLTTKSIVVESLTQDTAVSSQNSPIVMSISRDLNNDGISNISDLMVLVQHFNGVFCKVSGYVNPNYDYLKAAEPGLKAGFKVEAEGVGVSAVTDINGYFELLLPSKSSGGEANTDTKESAYTLKISKVNYLYKEIKIDTLSKDVLLSTPESPIKMEIGDFNADNAVNISDIMLVVSVFNSTKGEEKFVEDYDINKDGAINIIDILIVTKNYCKTAPLV